MIDKLKETIEGLKRIKIGCFKNSMVTGVSVESKQINIPLTIYHAIQLIESLDKAGEELGEIGECNRHESAADTPREMCSYCSHLKVIKEAIDIAKPLLAKALLKMENFREARDLYFTELQSAKLRIEELEKIQEDYFELAQCFAEYKEKLTVENVEEIVSKILWDDIAIGLMADKAHLNKYQMMYSDVMVIAKTLIKDLTGGK